MSRLTPHLLAAVIAAGAVACDDANDTNAPAAPGATQVRLTQFALGQDPGQPAYLNHRIPVSFALSGTGIPASADEPASVAVTFSFIEPGADPVDAAGCSSNAIIVPLTADGVPEEIDAFIWPTSDCAELVGAGRALEVIAEFYMDEPIDGVIEVDLPTLNIAPGQIDIAYGLTADSSVALLPFIEEGESRTPSLLVQSSFVYNGRDPYVAKVTADEIPADLRDAVPDIEEQLKFGLDDAALDQIDALPGTATIRYTLAPQGDPDAALPLTVGAEGGGTADVVEVERVDPGIAMQLAHDLYIEGDALDAVSAGGDWADQTAFVVRGCMQADFEQEFGDAEDCQDVAVELVRETAESSGASELSFDRRLERSVGNSRIRVTALMETANRLTRSGAFSRTEGRVDLNGRLGRSFRVTMVGAHAEAELSAERAAYDAAVVAFDQTIFSASDERESSLTNEQEFSADKSFRIGSLGFGFGPIRLGFTIDVGGRVGLDIEDELSLIVDGEECQALLNTEAGMPACGRVARTVTPNFALTARVFGGIRLRVVRAGVEATLRLVETRFPLTTQLGFGLTDEESFLVRGDVDWDMTLQLINGRVQLVGSIGFRRFRRSRRVNLFSFGSRVQTFDLLSRGMVEPLELL